MSRVYRLGLQPMEERYTGQWARWIPDMLRGVFDEVVDVPGLGAPQGSVKTGAFLDLFDSAAWQADQLRAVAEAFRCGAVRAGDAFWFDDIEFPGMEQVRYLSRLSGTPVFIFGFLHAASYTRADFMAQMADVGQYAERAWVAACDAVFVGSEYHAQAFASRRCFGAQDAYLVARLHATGNPFVPSEVEDAARPYTAFRDRPIHVLFPHRPDREKRPATMLAAVPTLVKAGCRVAFTTGRAAYRSTNDQATADAIAALPAQYPGMVEVYVGLTRSAYYRLLGQARVVVSTAIEENYGYAMAEAIAARCIPWMPRRYAYPELLTGPSQWTQRSVDEWLDQQACLYRGAFKDSLGALVHEAHGYGGWTDGVQGQILRRLEGAAGRIQRVIARTIEAGA